MNGSKGQSSPRWGSTTKLVVALTFLTVIALLLTFYHTIVGPLVLALIISYLLHPLADHLSRHLRLPWGASVNIIYIVFVLLLLFLIISGGVFLINQMQSLVVFIQAAIKDLPTTLNNIAIQKYTVGPFVIDLTTLDLTAVVNQVLSAAQSMVGQIGSVLGSVASSTAVVLGWIFFVVMISYFVLAESKGAPEIISNFNLPGYEDDLRQMEKHLARIWSAFLRGQLIVTSINVLLYSILLGSLGVNYFYVLAVVAGFARFIPYLGAWISWTTFGLVAFFQGTTILGLDPWHYVLVVLIASIVLDSIMDNMITPRILSDALQVHPAAVMVAALIGLNWLGIIGVILAAPVLATFKLAGTYALMKMMDKNPWSYIVAPPQAQPAEPIHERIIRYWQVVKEYFTRLNDKDS